MREGLIKNLQNDSVWFEQMVLARFFFDPIYTNQYMGIFCVTHDEQKKAEPCNDFSTPQLMGLYHAIKLYLQISGPCGGRVSPELFQRCLQLTVEQSLFVSASDIPELACYLDSILGADWKPTVQLLNDYTQEWLKIRRTSLLLHKYKTEQWQPDELRTRIGSEVSRIEESGGSKDTMFAFGHGIDNPEVEVPRLLTRIAGLDRALGGGPGYGEGFLFIAGTGVGKTVLATQLAMNFSVHGRKKGLMVTTEEKHRALEKRIVANYCQIPYTMLLKDNFRIDSLSPTHQEAYAKLRAEMKDRLIIYEWPKGVGRSVQNGLSDDLKRAADKMGGIDYMVLDWIGGAISEGESDPGVVRMLYQNGGDTMAELADTQKIVTISFAQAHIDRCYNKLMVDSRALAECKQLGRNMTGIVGVSGMVNPQEEMMNGRPNYSDDQALYISKARKGEGGLVRVKRQMNLQRFLDMSQL